MYVLIRENLTHLGGPMGTEYTYADWRKYFTTIEKAKRYAVKDSAAFTKATGEALRWRKERRGACSQDCGSHMYFIRPVKVEE